MKAKLTKKARTKDLTGIQLASLKRKLAKLEARVKKLEAKK